MLKEEAFLLAFPSHLLASARAAGCLLSSRNGHEEPRYRAADEGVPRGSGVVLPSPSEFLVWSVCAWERCVSGGSIIVTCQKGVVKERQLASACLTQ